MKACRAAWGGYDTASMIRPTLSFIAAVLLAGLGVTPAASELTAPLPGWLAGTWAMEDGARWADEIWTSPRGGMMLGLGRAGFGPDVESWESSRIVRRADGVVSLVAQQKGGAALDYPLVVAGSDSMEFANAAHEPQRIRFTRQGQLLMIETSKIDGSDAVRRNYRPVETAPKD